MKILKLQQGGVKKYMSPKKQDISYGDPDKNILIITFNKDGQEHQLKGIWNNDKGYYDYNNNDYDLLNYYYDNIADHYKELFGGFIPGENNPVHKTPVEKPLKLVFPEFNLLTGGRGLFNMFNSNLISQDAISKGLNNTLTMTNPSSIMKGYGSIGNYTTPLGTTGASLSGALADTSIASSGLYNIGKLFYDNPSITSGAETVLAISPLGLIGNKFRYIPRAFKVGKDLYNKGRMFDGALKTERTLSALYNVLKSPKYVDALYEYPYVLKQTPLYLFKDYSGKLMYKYGKDTARELAKGPIFPNSLHVEYLSPNSSQEELIKGFEEARKSFLLNKLADRYSNYISHMYLKLYNELSQDPVWKSIIDESPQYIKLILNYINSNSTKSKEDFVKSLIERSNSYRRFMREPHTPDEFKTFKGHSISSDKPTIDVEGFNRSDWFGEYGRYPAYYQGLPNIQGPIETWWSLRIPEGVNVKPGVWRMEKALVKFRNKINKNNFNFNKGLSDALDLEKALITNLKNKKVPRNYYSIPVHLIFEGNKGEKLPNFKVTVGELPKDFKWGLGYRNGGKLNKYE